MEDADVEVDTAPGDDEVAEGLATFNSNAKLIDKELYAISHTSHVLNVINLDITLMIVQTKCLNSKKPLRRKTKIPRRLKN